MLYPALLSVNCNNNIRQALLIYNTPQIHDQVIMPLIMHSLYKLRINSVYTQRTVSLNQGNAVLKLPSRKNFSDSSKIFP